MAASTQPHATVQEVKSADPNKMIFDGQKADVYINTNQLGGNHFLVRVTDPGGAPKLIAIHL
jgi:hypothetical protein